MDPVSEALGDRDRRRILVRLGHGPTAIAALCEELALDEAIVTEHLEMLDHAGLVERTLEIDGGPPVHRLRTEAFVAIEQLLSAYEELWRSRVDALHVEVARGASTHDTKGST